MSCKASDFIVGTLGSHGMFKQERMVLQEAPLVHSGKWAWGPAWKQRVARPLLLAGENGTGEKWVDFGGSFFPSWCLDSGAWGRVMSDLRMPRASLGTVLRLSGRWGTGAMRVWGTWMCLGDLRDSWAAGQSC